MRKKGRGTKWKREDVKWQMGEGTSDLRLSERREETQFLRRCKSEEGKCKMEDVKLRVLRLFAAKSGSEWTVKGWRENGRGKM
jgi:hypothetical protein